MPSLDTVLAARRLLAEITPLAGDCGRFCGGACCRGDAGTGMLLFPEEAQLYRGCRFGRVIKAHYSIGGHIGRLFVCGGACPRELRPLSCRLFPLLPAVRAGASPDVRMDPRSASVCPLHGSGVAGLSPAFVAAVREAAAQLSADPACRRFLADLDRMLSL